MRRGLGQGKHKAIDASYISKSGKKPPYIGKFWSGCASAMKRNIKIVVHYSDSGGHKIYFSTDIDISRRDIIKFYRTRFQIEFCFRKAKQFAGLSHCQAKDLQKLDFAFNASITAVNVAKIMRREFYPELSSDLKIKIPF